jgi:uncharacterized membrane protein (DUF2068 family)
MPPPKGLRAVALLEGSKGLLVVLAGFGALELLHHDVQTAAEELVRHLHLNPAGHYPRIFIKLAAQLTDSRLWLLGVGASLYAVVRFIEAYGLWRQRRWATWFAVISGAVYLPLEVWELMRGVTWAKTELFIVNLGVVAYTCHVIFLGRRSAQFNDWQAKG